METIDRLINDLWYLGANLPFIEYYSHTGEDMYKILNPYTKFKTDTKVLCPVRDGFLKALAIAAPLIAREKYIFEKE